MKIRDLVGLIISCFDRMGDLAKKRKIRGGHKGYVTKELQTLETVITGSSEGKEVLLRDLQDILTEALKKVLKLDEEIVELLEEEKDIELEIAEASKFWRDVRRAIEKIEAYFKTANNDGGSTNTPASPAQAGIPSQVSPHVVKAKLPKHELKKFYGSVHHWQSFWDAFKNAVHENTQLSEIDKFTYLKGLLEGEASIAVAGLSLTEANYGAAVEILSKRFGDEQKIISSHMERLLKVKEGPTPAERV